MRNVKGLLSTIFIALVMILSGCVSTQPTTSNTGTTGSNSSNSETTTGENVDVVKIGVVIPLTGASSQIGAQVQKGYDLAEEKINAAGGIESLGGAKIEFVYADHTSKPDVGAREAQRLIDEGVAMITGSYETGVTMSVAQAAERLKVPYLVPYTAGNSITESGFTYTFRTRPPSTVWVTAQYDFLTYLNEEHGKNIKKVAALWEDGAWGQGTGEDIINIGKEKGFEVAADVSFKSNSQDLSPQLTKIKASGAEAILAASYLGDTMKAQQTMSSLNFKRPYMSIGTTEVHDDFFQLGDLAEGQVGSSAWLPDINEKSTEVGKEFEEKFGVPMNDDAAYAYSAAYIILEALEATGSLDKEQLTEVFRTKEFVSEDANIIPTKDGVIKFNEKGQSEGVIIIAQAQDGNWVTVWPQAYASSEFRDGQWTE